MCKHRDGNFITKGLKNCRDKVIGIALEVVPNGKKFVNPFTSHLVAKHYSYSHLPYACQEPNLSIPLLQATSQAFTDINNTYSAGVDICCPAV